jgi:hypothetical protein
VSDSRQIETGRTEFESPRVATVQPLFAPGPPRESNRPVKRRGSASDALAALLPEWNALARLPVEYDEEGLSPPSPTAVRNAIALIVRLWSRYLERFGEAMPLARVRPGAHAGVDLHWALPSFELLAHVTDAEPIPVFVGNDYSPERPIRAKPTTQAELDRMVTWVHDVWAASR